MTRNGRPRSRAAPEAVGAGDGCSSRTSTPSMSISQAWVGRRSSGRRGLQHHEERQRDHHERRGRKHAEPDEPRPPVFAGQPLPATPQRRAVSHRVMGRPLGRVPALTSRPGALPHLSPLRRHPRLDRLRRNAGVRAGAAQGGRAARRPPGAPGGRVEARAGVRADRAAGELGRPLPRRSTSARRPRLSARSTRWPSGRPARRDAGADARPRGRRAGRRRGPEIPVAETLLRLAKRA